MASVNEKTISLSVLSTTAAINAAHVITSGDSGAYILEVTFTDLTAISGTCQLHCVRGDGQMIDITDGVVIAGNKVTYTLDSALYAVSGLVIYMQFLNSNIYTPLKISFSGIRVLPTSGSTIAELNPYPDRAVNIISQAEYEALDPVNANTIYFVEVT